VADLFVYAVGDSVMWGQGLDEDAKFAIRAARSLAQARGLTPKLKLRAHSGAKIKATREQRKAFVRLFPGLFKDQIGSDDAFVESADERPAEQLHGEINRAFPTILHQLSRIPDTEGTDVDVLLINGGADDLDFAGVLEEETSGSGTGDFLTKYDAEFERVMHDDVIELLGAARDKCPNAHIVLTGYYSPFSIASRFGDMQDFFLEMAHKEGAYEFLSTLRAAGPVAGFFLLGFVGGIAAKIGVDRLWSDANDQIEAAVNLARALSEAGESRWLYWMRRAVTEINEDPSHAGIRGPGVAFAAPGFTKLNCAFAGDTFVWQRFEQDDLDDDKHDIRAAECPRNDLRDQMVAFSHIELSVPPLSDSVKSDRARALLNELDGPEALLDALTEYAEDPGFGASARVNQQLKTDIDRIDLTRIGSIIHPNRNGAARYAAVVHKCAEELRQVSVRNQLRAFLTPNMRPHLSDLSVPVSPDVGNPPAQSPPPQFFDVGKAIRRLGFDPSVGLKACLAHAEPVVIGLKVTTASTSDLLAREAFLHLGFAHKWHLGHLLGEDLGDTKLNPHFRRNTTDFFTIDVTRRPDSPPVKIGDITRATIEFEEPTDETDKSARWSPEEVTLSIDGHDVLTHTLELREVRLCLDLAFPEEFGGECE
jgi:hypothetical protein